MSVSSHSRGRRFTAYSTHINSSDNYGRRCLTTEWWHAGVVICLDLGADLRMAQLMPVPLTVSCFSKIQIGFAFLVPAHPGSPGKRAVKRVCVCVSNTSKSASLLSTILSEQYHFMTFSGTRQIGCKIKFNYLMLPKHI